jgi:hypothetical protein
MNNCVDPKFLFNIKQFIDIIIIITTITSYSIVIISILVKFVN